MTRNKWSNRATLRGKPLDSDCRKAKISIHEYGLHDGRTFCYGLMHAHNDEYYDKCKECKAFVDNAKPLAELGGK